MCIIPCLALCRGINPEWRPAWRWPRQRGTDRSMAGLGAHLEPLLERYEISGLCGRVGGQVDDRFRFP